MLRHPKRPDLLHVEQKKLPFYRLNQALDFPGSLGKAMGYNSHYVGYFPLFLTQNYTILSPEVVLKQAAVPKK